MPPTKIPPPGKIRPPTAKHSRLNQAICDDMSQKLAVHVRRYPILVNKAHPDYMRRDKKALAWRNLAVEVQYEPGKYIDFHYHYESPLLTYLFFSCSGETLGNNAQGLQGGKETALWPEAKRVGTSRPKTSSFLQVL